MRAHATADTSIDAFAIHRATGRLSAQQSVIAAFLATNCHRGWTRAEIAAATGVRLSAVCGRISELIALWRVEELPRRVCSETGSNAHPIRIAEVQGRLFQ